MTALVAGVTVPVFAQTAGLNVDANARVNAGENTNAELRAKANANTNTDARAEAKTQATAQRITKAKEQAQKEIDRRIQGLTKMSTRVDGMKRVSATGKTTVSATVQAEIAKLTALKAKVAASTDIETLRADIKSITQSHRIYALIMPQSQIITAADKIVTTADSMTTLSTKLQTRITEAKAAGKDVSAQEAALVAFTAKLADAKVQAAAAISLTSGLTPDNGDNTKAAANRKALMDARAKIKAGNESLRAAYAEAKKVINNVKSIKIEARANATTSASTTAQ